MSVARTYSPIVLEPASQAFVEATASPPFLDEMTPDEARKVLDDVQAAPIDKLAVDERWITVPADVGDGRGPTAAERARRSLQRRQRPSAHTDRRRTSTTCRVRCASRSPTATSPSTATTARRAPERWRGETTPE